MQKLQKTRRKPFRSVSQNLLVSSQVKVKFFEESLMIYKACEKCKNEKRKTINGDDILFAMNTLGFENYFDILHTYLQKYR